MQIYNKTTPTIKECVAVLGFFDGVHIGHRELVKKAIAESKPNFKLSFNALETNPTIAGPEEHPASPARARSANIVVPPLGHLSEARLYVPGHIAPTEKPHIPQPIREITGIGESDAIR